MKTSLCIKKGLFLLWSMVAVSTYAQAPRSLSVNTWRFGAQLTFEQMITSRQSRVASGIWQVRYRRLGGELPGYPVADFGYRWLLGPVRESKSIRQGWLLTGTASYARVKGYPDLQYWYRFNSYRMGASLGYRLLAKWKLPMIFEGHAGLAYQIVGLSIPPWAERPAFDKTLFLPPYEGFLPNFAIHVGLLLK